MCTSTLELFVAFSPTDAKLAVRHRVGRAPPRGWSPPPWWSLGASCKVCVVKVTIMPGKAPSALRLEQSAVNSKEVNLFCYKGEGLGDGGNGQILVKRYKLLVIRRVSSGELMYRVVTVVDNTVLYT